jgi:hypothetical protein
MVMVTHVAVRSTGWAGISFLVLVLAPLPLSGNLGKPFPYVSDSTEQITQFFAADRVVTLIQVFAFTLALLAFLWFTIGLRSYLEAADGDRFFPQLMSTSATAGAATYMVANALYGVAAMAGTPAHPLSEALLRAALDGSVFIFAGGYGFVALMLLAAGFSIRRTRALPGWLAVSAFVLAASHLVYSVFVPLVHDGPLVPYSWLSLAPYGLFFAWAAATGVCLLTVRIPASETGDRLNSPAMSTRRAEPRPSR